MLIFRRAFFLRKKARIVFICVVVYYLNILKRIYKK